MSKFDPYIDSYNNALKLLFSHPDMIESLIKGFVPQAWVKDLDFSTLRKENIENITDDLRERESDVIWSIAFKDQTIYIVCLIEFQSGIDKFMAIKVLTYIGLIYQDLLKQKNRTLMDGKLPPVFSFGALYWNKSLECTFTRSRLFKRSDPEKSAKISAKHRIYDSRCWPDKSRSVYCRKG